MSACWCVRAGGGGGTLFLSKHVDGVYTSLQISASTRHKNSAPTLYQTVRKRMEHSVGRVWTVDLRGSIDQEIMLKTTINWSICNPFAVQTDAAMCSCLRSRLVLNSFVM